MLNQFPAAPVPTLSGFPMPLPAAVSQQPLLPAGPPASLPLSIGPPVMGLGISAAAPAGGAAAPPAGAFAPSYPPGQVRALPGCRGPAGTAGLFPSCLVALDEPRGAAEEETLTRLSLLTRVERVVDFDFMFEVDHVTLNCSYAV